MSERKPLILSVDDDTVARYARKRLLTNAGFDVIEAANGQEALDRLVDGPDLVVLDVGLPDISGFEVCRRIKEKPETSFIAVLQVSASFVRSADRTRALEGGADNFVIEPVEPEVLIATVRAMLRVRHAEEAVRRAAGEWQATFEAINEGVAVLDADGHVLRCNRAFGELLGRPCSDVVHASWEGLLQALSSDDGRIDSSTVGSQLPRRSFRRGDRWIQLSMTESTDGTRVGRIVVLTDVTDHMKALSDAEEANRIKDDFLAVLSHELRTPLNAIVGWAHLLQSGQLDSATAAKAVETISRNANAQNQLISDILDVSRIVAGKVRLEITPVDVASIVDAAVDTLKLAAVAKKIQLDSTHHGGPTLVSGDGSRLQQVVWNLLSNAIKFAPRGGHVSAAVTTVDDDIQIVVEDDGPGVAPDFLPYVFDRFRQADSSSTRPKGGLGLGLAIVRHLIELHGGTVEAANREGGKGARFTVRLPRRGPDGGGDTMAALFPQEGDYAGDAASLKKVRVMIVDDEEDARDLLATVLRSAGADVVTAASAAEALTLVERHRPDVFIADLEMPGEDGYSLIRKIRHLPGMDGVEMPAIALTAYAAQEDRLRALGAGFQIHVAKPARPRELIEVVAGLAGRLRVSER